MKQIKGALISVFYKDGLDEIVKKLDSLGVEIYSTGGTYDYIVNLGIKAKTVEGLTSYPSILGGRVKTLHPKVFGGILSRRDNQTDIQQVKEYDIPNIDLVIVDPPRAGLDTKTISNIKRINAKNVIYISCDPVTLARDISNLKDMYKVIIVKPFNMFPRTYHCESITVLERK